MKTKSFFLLAFTCLFFTSTSLFGRSPKLTLLYKGKPLCYWTVTLKLGSAVYGEAVTDDRGVVEFDGVKMPSLDFDLKGVKKTANGEKKWSVSGMFRFKDENYTATIEFDDVVKQMVSFMGGSEADFVTGWGLPTSGECEKPATSSTSSSNAEKNTSENKSNNSTFNTTSNSNGNNSSTSSDVDDLMEKSKRENEKNMADMKAQQEKQHAAHMENLKQQKPALEEKIKRLNDKITRAQGELSSLTPGTTEHSNKSYELRDYEIERNLSEIKLDRTIDELANNGYLKKSERQKYDAKTEPLEEEQKQLVKNKKNGIPYGTTADEAKLAKEKEKESKKEIEKAKEKEKEAEKEKEEKEKEEKEKIKEEGDKKEQKKNKEEDEDDAPFKIYTSEELQNMSTFDLKRTKLSNANSINKRELKLKVKAAFLSQDKKAQIQSELDALYKQIESIKVILASRNEKDENPEGKKE